MLSACGTALLLVGCAGSGESLEPPAPEGNLAVLVRLSSSIADSLAGSLGTTFARQTTLHVEPAGNWFVFDAFERALRSRGVAVVAAPAAGTAKIDVNVIEAVTAYENSRRAWLFGASDIDRRIRVHLRVRTERADSPAVVVTSSTFREFRDTQGTGAIARLETEGVPASRGSLPEGGWIEDFAEPIIVAGAIIVAVVLLFTVRS